MPSQRRVRLVFYVGLVGFIALLFFTSHMRQTRSSDTRTISDIFYRKTVNALDKKARSGKTSGSQGTHGDKNGGGKADRDDEDLARKMSERLKAAEQQAKENANAKSPNRPDKPVDVIGVGSSAGGQGKEKPVDVSGIGSAVGDQGKQAPLGTTPSEKVDVTDEAVELELKNILKKAPVVIFSKTFCPFSKKAKGLLLEKYTIDPLPYVVELDEHKIGPQLQAKLAILTGRKTVPNVLVNGKSIGGSDELAELDIQKTLAAKIKTLSNKGVEVRERFVEALQQPVR